ncbi:hypothetical protein B296_00012751 [Ensete ventricosum]|uniref:Uncharacterized protein n=1 Tax=Ensete ventricosum TaxID=4639 RepID=A0A426Y928_ENSVE|nr:hypothetical protein B296_00012751 [Ensete ventricosum]
MMLKVFLDNDLGSIANDRKKEYEKGIHMTPTAMMPSISMLALPEHDNVFVLGADISRVGISLNQLWVLMQCTLISSYFHDFTEERTMMLKVFPDDVPGSMAHNCKKEQEKGIHITPIVMMPSILMLTLPERGNVFILGADTSRVGIDV